jgi:hypothetical protein
MVSPERHNPSRVMLINVGLAFNFNIKKIYHQFLIADQLLRHQMTTNDKN